MMEMSVHFEVRTKLQKYEQTFQGLKGEPYHQARGRIQGAEESVILRIHSWQRNKVDSPHKLRALVNTLFQMVSSILDPQDSYENEKLRIQIDSCKEAINFYFYPSPAYLCEVK